MRNNRDNVESTVSRRLFLTAAGQVAFAAGVGRFLPRMFAGQFITDASGQAGSSADTRADAWLVNLATGSAGRVSPGLIGGRGRPG